MMAWIWISKMNVSGIFKNTDLPYTKNILYLSSSGWQSILGCILKFVLDKILQYFYSIFLRLLFIEARIFNIYDRARRLNFFCKFIFMIPFFNLIFPSSFYIIFLSYYTKTFDCSLIITANLISTVNTFRVILRILKN